MVGHLLPSRCVAVAAATRTLRPSSIVLRSDSGCLGLWQMKVENRLIGCQATVGQVETTATEAGSGEDQKWWDPPLLMLAVPVGAADMQDMSPPTLLIVSLGQLDTAAEVVDYAERHHAVDSPDAHLAAVEVDQIDPARVDSSVRLEFYLQSL